MPKYMLNGSKASKRNDGAQVLHKQTHQPRFESDKTELQFHTIFLEASTADCFDLVQCAYAS